MVEVRVQHLIIIFLKVVQSEDYDMIGNVQLSANDKKDLQAAIEVFGEPTIKVTISIVSF